MQRTEDKKEGQDQGKEFNTPRAQRTRRKNKDKIKVRSLIYLEDRGQEERTTTKLFLKVYRRKILTIHHHQLY